MAEASGIEPLLTESKSVVLPLHNAPTVIGACSWFRTTGLTLIKRLLYP